MDHQSRVCLFVALTLAATVATAKYVYLHDETVWTKHTWDALKLRFPLEKLMQEDELEHYEMVSSKGTHSRDSLQQGLEESKLQR